MKPHQTPTNLQPMLCWDGSVVTSDAVLLGGWGRALLLHFHIKVKVDLRWSLDVVFLRFEETQYFGGIGLFANHEGN